MKESKRRPVRLKGVVLVMVVTLLFILVVMLMATLTVVGNANKRTVTKFEENQAYYTARSALGVYITGMLEMDENADLGENGAKRAADALKSKFTDVSSSQLNVFYKNKTDSSEGYADFGGEQSIVEGFVYQQELFGYLEPKYKLKDQDEAGNDLKRGAVMTAAPGKDSNWEINDDAVDNNKYFVKYKVKVPDVNSVTGMGSNGNVGVMATEDVDVTVELLRMVYLDKDDKLITDGVMAANNADGAAKIMDVDWSKTYYRVKVTSTAKIKQGTGGVNEGTVSVILEPKVVNSPSAFKNALTTFEETTLPTKGFTVGGASAALPAGGSGSYKAQNDSTWVGSYVYRYDAVETAASGFTWNLFEDDSFVVQKGYINIVNIDKIGGKGDINATSQEDLDKRPYIYAGGINLPNQFKLGSDDGAVDLVIYKNQDFCNNVWLPDVTGINKSDAVFNVNQESATYDIYGDVYCDGDMYISYNTKFHGNVFCTGNIIVKGDSRNADGTPKNGWCFDKNAKIGGNVINTSGQEIISITSKNGGTVTVNDGTLVGFKDTNCPWGNEWKSNIDSVPKISFGGLTNRSEKEVSTVKNITKTYRDNLGDIIPADIFIKKQTKQDSMSLTVKSNAMNLSKSTHLITKDFTLNGSNVTLSNVIDPTDSNVATYNSATDFYEMKLNASDYQNDNEKYYIDATGGNVQIQLTGSMDSMRTTFIVVGDNDVVFTVADNDSFKSLCNILSYDIYQMLENDSTFNLGDRDKVKAAGLEYPKAPKIYYYIGENGLIDAYNGDTSRAWAGYMYGPEAMFQSNSSTGRTIHYTYDGNPSSGSYEQKFVFLYGSMVFKNINGGNDLGVAFIDPGDGGGGGATEGKVLWKRQRYLNR